MSISMTVAFYRKMTQCFYALLIFCLHLFKTCAIRFLSTTRIDNGDSFVYFLFNLSLDKKKAQRHFFITKKSHKSTQNTNFLHIDIEIEESRLYLEEKYYSQFAFLWKNFQKLIIEMTCEMNKQTETNIQKTEIQRHFNDSQLWKWNAWATLSSSSLSLSCEMWMKWREMLFP